VDEPNFSSASAQAGDPVICHARNLEEFGRAVFPRGAYLAGHLAESKEPGHFWGKGSLKLEFDRISLSDTTLPVPGKIVAVRGYRVDREGKIIGHGHPRRDAVEWMIPPLWPWKVVSLPARGPRPTLKGETQITLRLMDDVEVPPVSAALRPAGAQSAALRERPWRPPAEWSAMPVTGSRPHIRYLPPSISGMPSEASDATLAASSAAPAAESVLATRRAVDTLIALKREGIYDVTDYWIDGDQLFCVLRSGGEGVFDLNRVDWERTIQLNAERGITLNLRGRPRVQ